MPTHNDEVEGAPMVLTHNDEVAAFVAALTDQLKDLERDVFNAEQYALDLGKRVQLLETAADAAKEFMGVTEEWVPDVRTWDSHKKLSEALKAVASG